MTTNESKAGGEGNGFTRDAGFAVAYLVGKAMTSHVPGEPHAAAPHADR